MVVFSYLCAVGNRLKIMRYALIMIAACLVACGPRASQRGRGNAGDAPVRYGYKIVNSHPHDTGAYTQGLFWSEGELYESTGEHGSSTLRRVDPATGEVRQKIALADHYFGEGTTLIGDEIFQLTWQQGKCFVYDADTFELRREFSYKGEGWGLTTDGAKLYMSDGTPNIVVRNPATFDAERTIVVRNAGRPVYDVNELEWIEGRIWANIYMTNEVIIIDPADGRVEGVIDFTGIVSRLIVTRDTDVMNGIAWDEEGERIFVTGKNWNRLFEIEIFKK